MKTINRIKTFYHEKNIKYYASVTGTFAMGTLHLAAAVMHFSWLTFNYCLFSYLLVLIRLLLTYMDTKLVKRRLFLVGAVSLAVLVIPMTVAMVKTIREKDAPVYFFFWMIYLYATYGTVKFIMAIRTRHKARKNGDVCNGVLSWITLVSALYTMQMMEFALIATFDTSRSRSMMIMQYLTHGAILIFTLFIIVHLITAFIKAGNKTY